MNLILREKANAFNLRCPGCGEPVFPLLCGTEEYVDIQLCDDCIEAVSMFDKINDGLVNEWEKCHRYASYFFEAIERLEKSTKPSIGENNDQEKINTTAK